LWVSTPTGTASSIVMRNRMQIGPADARAFSEVARRHHAAADSTPTAAE